MSNYTRKDILQKIKERQSLDGKNLSGLDLSLIDFGEISLQKANLRGANLQQSVFLETNLQDANLSGADLRGADLHMADLSQARLNGADLSEANLHMTKLVQADLRRANLQKANLHGSDLRRANLAGADFEDALLLGANLGEALLTVSDFKKLDLSQAINSSVKFVEHSLFEPNDSSDEGKEEKAEEIRPAVNEHTERLGLKFYVEQKKNQNTTQVFLGKALTPVSGFEKKDQTGKNKGKIAAVAVSAVVLGIILFTGIFRLESNSGFYKGFRLISPPGKGYIQGEILRFRAAAGDEGKRERLWVELIDNFNEKPVFDHLIRDEKDPRIWELEIDSQIIKSGNYRLFYGPSKKKLAPVENADKVIISVAPPKYDLTRILSAQGNRSYSLHFIGSLVQTGQENIPYLLVKIGPYRMVTIRPEPVAVQNKEVKYQLDVKLNGLKKTDLSEGEGNFYEEYLCDRAGHKKLIYKVTGMAEFFEKPGRAVDYRQGSVSREFTALITPDGKKQPADLFPVSENPGFKLVAKNQADEPGTFELTISRPANFLKSAVYLYQDNRLFGVTCETTFKVSGRWEGGHYHGLLIPEGKDVVYKSNILRTEVTGKYKKPDRAIGNKNKIDIYVKKSGKSKAGNSDLRLTIYEYIGTCKKFAEYFPQKRRTHELISGFFNDYDLTGIENNFDLLSQLLNKPKYGLRLSSKNFLSLLGQGDLNFEGIRLSYQDVSSLSKAPLNLKGVKLMGATLSFIKLAGADLSRANLSGADLRGADLRGAILDGAVVDSHTIISLPPEYQIIQKKITKR